MSGSGSEFRAYTALAELLREAERVRALFQANGLELPGPLDRLFESGRGAIGNHRAPRRDSIPAPVGPDPPEGYRDDWLWLPLTALGVRSLSLGILRALGGTAPTRQIIDAIVKLKPDQNEVSIMNLGPALEKSGHIRRGESGWELTDASHAPLVSGEYAWGPAGIYGKAELAAHRRAAIIHLLALSYNRSGLQIVQITEQLRGCSWMHAPCTKDLVKMDLAHLKEEGLVRRVGNGRKWELVEK